MVLLSENDGSLILENDWEKLVINEEGTYSIFDTASGKCIIKNAYLALSIKTFDGEETESISTEKSGTIILSLLDDYKKTIETEDTKDEIGTGRKVIIKQFNVEFQLVLTLEISIYKNITGLHLQVSIENNSEKKRIFDLYPFFVSKDCEEGSIDIGPVDEWHFLRTGYQSWSNTRVMKYKDNDKLPSIGWARFPHHMNYHESRPDGQVRSNYFTIIKNKKTEESLLFGFLTFRDQLTQFIFNFDCDNKDLISFYARSQADGLIIKNGETIKSERLFISYVKNEILNLKNYISLSGKLSGAKLWSHTPRGYCTWYNYYENVSQEDCSNNLMQIKSHKSNFPIEYFQLDDGYQIVCGEWPEPANKKFPDGMKWLVEKIKEVELKPGLWIAPFLISPLSELYKKHPDWVVKDEKGKPISGAWNPNLYGGSTSKLKFMRGLFSTLYVLDTTHPQAQNWLYDLFKKIVDEWGFEYIKIDFIYAAALRGLRYENITRAQAYRKGLEIIREAVGDEVFILGCGAPLGPSIGIVNGMRVSCDTAPNWDPFYAKISRKILKLPTTPSVLPAMANNMLLSFLHGNWWINDPDCLMIRSKNSSLSLDEVRTQITMIGLTNGVYMVSDNLKDLDVERMKLIKKFIPVDDITAIPLDLFDAEFIRPNISLSKIYFREVKTNYGSWYLVGFFNWSDALMEKHVLKFSDLGLDLNKRYHIYEFWSSNYFGIFEREIELPTLNSHACHLLRICEVKDIPSIIGSKFHFLQGKAEIQKYEFNEDTLQITMELKFPGYNQEDIFIYTPTRLYPYGSEYESINCNCEILKAEPNYLTINVEFTDSATVVIDLSKGDKQNNKKK
jgi:alpha-galactosidase